MLHKKELKFGQAVIQTRVMLGLMAVEQGAEQGTAGGDGHTLLGKLGGEVADRGRVCFSL